MRARRILAPGAALVGATLGCSFDPQAPPAPAGVPGVGYEIRQDAAYLAGRLQARDEPLALRSPEGRAAAPGTASSSVGLTLVGELAPPVVAGHVVQACDIDVAPLGRSATVAYNFAGPTAAGAAQIVDFTDPARPRLVAEVVFPRADVDAVVRRGSYIYCGVATDDPAVPGAAHLVEFRQISSGLVGTQRDLPLPSASVTDLAGDGDWLAATVGAHGGGVALVNRVSLQVTSFADWLDARACSFDPAGHLVTLASTGWARRAVPSLGVEAAADIDGLRHAGAKGTVEVHGSLSYVAAGEGGFQVLGADGALLDGLANNAQAGLGAELCVTNAVSVLNGLAFVAAGALGVRVVDLGRWSAAEPDPSAGGLALLGEIDFGDEVSSNMVCARGNTLVVAAGLGGVKLVRMTPPH